MNRIPFFVGLFLLLTFTACKSDPENQTPDTLAPGKTGISAVDNITEKITKDPSDVSLYVSRAQAYHRLEGYDEAIYDMNHAIKLDSTKPEYYLFLSDILLDYDKSKDALRVLNSAVFRFPENTNCLLKQAELYYTLKQYHQSTSAINLLLESDPNHAKAFFLYGQNYKELGDTIRAINSFQKAVDLDPDILAGWISLGNLWGKKGPTIAEKYFKTAISIDSTDVYALNSYALFLGNQDRYEESLKIYRKIAIRDPQFSDGFFNAGIMYLMIDSLKLANKQFDLAVKTNPTFAKAYYYRGLTFEQDGQLALAKSDYEQALKFDPAFQKAVDALAAIQ